MTITLSALQKQRYDTAANWTAENPTLLAGEIGVESDTGKIKIGTGSTAWTSLSYSGLIPGSGVYPYSQLLMPSGTAGAPSISFDGDGNTGIYLSGADALALSTSGVGRVFVDASGRVGVGAAPAYSVAGGATLSIGSGVGSAEASIYSSATGTGGVYFGDGTGAAAYSGFVEYSHASDFLRLATSGNERLRITSAGLVGIGTSSPGSKLQVVSTSAQDQLRFGYSTSVYTDAWMGTGFTVFDSIGGTGGAFDFRDDGTSRMFIDSSGNVGLGSTGPQGLLHLQQSLSDSTPILAIGEASNAVRYSIIQETGYTGISHGNQNIDLKFKTFLNSGSGGNISFWTGISSATERARIDSSGRLLVGTSSSSTADSLVLQGNSSNRTVGGADVRFRKASLPNADSQGLGTLHFEDNSGNVGARIAAISDGAWTSGSNHRSRLTFSTTADGASSPTERLRITSTGQVRLAGAGITFNGDTATANELDDYEEGNWSPVYVPSSGAFTTMTMNVSGARYVKIGQQVTVSAYFYTSSVDVTGASGTVSLSGLPFTTRTTQDVRYSGAIGYAVAFATKPIDWLIDSGVTTVNLLESKTNNDFLDVADLATGTGFLNAMYFTATYFVN